MDDKNQNLPADPELEDPELEEMDDSDEVEVTREELADALQAVVSDLSEGLKGTDRDVYTSADDLAQNDWFFAGVSDEEGQYAVTMWPAEGEDDMLRIDIGSEEDVHKLAANPEMVSAMTDDFIEAMSDEDYDEFEEYDEDEDEELDDEELEDDELEEDMMDDEDLEEDETIRNDGNLPPR